jgi:hypothetical protein
MALAKRLKGLPVGFVSTHPNPEVILVQRVGWVGMNPRDIPASLDDAQNQQLDPFAVEDVLVHGGIIHRSASGRT